MKKHLKEIVVVLLQLFIFYIFPLFAGPTDTMGMVVLMILSTTILATIMGVVSSNKNKFGYPIFVAFLFMPSIWIYYNESALMHSIWYLVVSAVGLLIGSIINKLIYK